MFRPMRRSKQQLSREETEAILTAGSSGVLALAGDEGYPYAVPISYVYQDGKLYFHCALTGHKMDAVRRSDKASFCVVAQDQVSPERYTTLYRSAIAFGRMRVVEDPAEKRAAALLLGEKYNPGHEAEANAEIDRHFANLAILELSIEHLSGKEGLELTRQRQA